MPKLLSIGRFAKLCHTTTDTLIHYDDIGLFPPANLTQRHRRYYHISQCYTFKTIQLLAELGFSLTDIRKMLSDNPLSNLSENLEQQICELELRKRNLENALQYVKRQQELPTQYEKIPFDKPFLITHEHSLHTFATLSQSYTFSTKEIIESLEHHINNCSQNHIYPFPIGFYIKKESLRAQNSHPILVYSPFPYGTENNRTLIRPAGKYAALIHKGSLVSAKNSIQQLKEYVTDYSCLPGDTFITCYDNCSLKYKDTYYLIETQMIPLTPFLL